MHMINSMPDSAASKIESLQKGAGTNINEAFGFTAFLASSIVSKTGWPKCI